jgi:hypothetical protein
VFWHNYFFHCAYTRYEAGLSIDEIWSYQPEENQTEEVAEQKAEAEAEETVVFDQTAEPEEPPTETAFTPVIYAGDGSPATGADVDATDGSPAGSMTNEFEFVGDSEYGGDADAVAELDELEAEIARELED